MRGKMKGQNLKAVEARERKQAVKQEKEKKKKEEAENIKWMDSDKHVNNKLQRKADVQQKQEEKIQKKEEIRHLAQQEEAALGSGKKKIDGAEKVTRAELMRRALLAKQVKTVSEPQCPSYTMEQGNINHMMRKIREEEAKEKKTVFNASGIDDALQLLSLDNGDIDRHPEKRMKAAYKAYEDEHLPKLREEYPSLKRSQLLQMIEKQWKKAPENPLNQQQLLQQNTLLNL